MYNSAPLATSPLPESQSKAARALRPEEFVYQAVTLAAILLVLSSVCLF